MSVIEIRVMNLERNFGALRSFSSWIWKCNNWNMHLAINSIQYILEPVHIHRRVSVSVSVFSYIYTWFTKIQQQQTNTPHRETKTLTVL